MCGTLLGFCDPAKPGSPQCCGVAGCAVCSKWATTCACDASGTKLCASESTLFRNGGADVDEFCRACRFVLNDAREALIGKLGRRRR